MQEEEVVKGEAVEEERRKRIEEEAKKEESKVKVPQKVGKEAEIISLKEEHTVVPLIKLEKVSELGLKGLEVSKEVPQVEKREITISIPIIKLQESSLMLKECELDYKLLKIEKRKRVLTVPMIRVNPLPKTSFSITEFDSEIRKPQQITLSKIRVPVYRKAISISPRFLLESFDSAISEQLKKRLEREEEVKKELVVERAEAETTEPLGPSLDVEEEEIPELFDLIFSISGSGKIDSSNPKVIGLEEVEGDQYLGTLRTLCMRIYREKVGGKPEPMIISKVNKKTFREEVERWMKAEDRIFSVSLDETEGLDKAFWDSVLDRIEELFSQRFGFIIFDRPVHFFPRHHIIDIINVKPKVMSMEFKKALASMIWGFIDLSDVEFPRFDYIFEVARKKFEAKLKSIGEPYLTVTKRDKGLHESDDLHYPIKLFLVKYLAKEMNLRHIDQIKEIIQTEYEGLGDYRPDIYISLSADKFASQIFEVETLFGEGDYPLKKIDETIERYEKASWTYKVNIIIDNLTFLRHINELKKKLNLHRSLKAKGKRMFDLEFYTLDLQNERLVSLSEIVKKVEEFIGDIRWLNIGSKEIA